MMDTVEQLTIPGVVGTDDDAAAKAATKRAKNAERMRAARARIAADPRAAGVTPYLIEQQREKARLRMAAKRAQTAPSQAEKAAKRATGKTAEREKRRDTRKAATLERPVNFVGVDGEAVVCDDGVTRFTLFAAADEDGAHTLHNPDGIGTLEAFEFLFRIRDAWWRRTNRPPRFIGYFCGYDINMLLRDVPREKLDQLWDTHKTRITVRDDDGQATGVQYALDWLPTKRFMVTRHEAREFVHPQTGEKVWAPDKKTFTIEDGAGFFGTSFLKAITDWGIGTEAERAFIAEYKNKRGGFTDDDMENITRYNALECELLRQLMHVLARTLSDAKLKPQAWMGAGCVAAAMLRNNGVPKHNVQPPEYAQAAVMRAYYGARTQAFTVGIVPHLHQYDVRSAYPAAMLELPSLIGAWRPAKRYEADAPYAVWRVRWNTPENDGITPFPYRLKTDAIWWPTTGEGWYWAPEVSAAMRHFNGGEYNAVTVKEGFVFEPVNPDARPFAFLQTLFDRRAEYKEAGDKREKVLKLGMNSCYGKTAQGVGTGKDGERPEHQSYVWAGMLTSATRAKILDAAMHAPADVLGFATDCVTSRVPLPVVIGKGLGEWEHSESADAFLLRPGVSHIPATDTQREERTRTRGFSKTELDETRWAELRAKWCKAKPAKRLDVSVSFPIQRFIGLGIARAWDWWDRWGTFQTFTTSVRPLQSERAKAERQPDGTYRFYPLDIFQDGIKEYAGKLSYPYRVKEDMYSTGHEGEDDPQTLADRRNHFEQRMFNDEQPEPFE